MASERCRAGGRVRAMPHVRLGWVVLAIAFALTACKSSSDSSEAAHTVTPAPPQEAPAIAPAAPEVPSGVQPPAEDAPAPTPTPEPTQPAATADKAASAKTATPKTTDQPADKTAKKTADEPTSPAPEAKAEPQEPPKPDEPAPSEPKPKTKIASTKNVRVSVDAGMQKLLDADPRMEKWITSVIGVADKCYADIRSSKPDAQGAVKVRVTMHANERPSPDIRSLPSQLSSLVVCATGKLMSKKMPLFTGPEGEKHDITIHFTL